MGVHLVREQASVSTLYRSIKTGPEQTSQNYPHPVPLTNVPAIDSEVFLRPLGRRQIVLREEINLTSPTGPLDACINLFGRKKCGSSVKAMLEIGEDGRNGVTLATRPYWLLQVVPCYQTCWEMSIHICFANAHWPNFI